MSSKEGLIPVQPPLVQKSEIDNTGKNSCMSFLLIVLGLLCLFLLYLYMDAQAASGNVNEIVQELEISIKELKMSMREMSCELSAIDHVSSNMTALKKEVESFKKDDQIEFEKIQQKLDEQKKDKGDMEKIVVDTINKNYKKDVGPVNYASLLLEHSALWKEPSIIGSILNFIKPKQKETAEKTSVDLFMKTHKYKSEEIPRLEALFLAHDKSNEVPFIEIVLSQRVAPTELQYIHIPTRYIEQTEHGKAKPVRLVVQGKQFSDQSYMSLGEKKLSRLESTVSINLTQGNPQGRALDKIKLLIYAAPDAKYVCLYRVQIFSESSQEVVGLEV